MPNKNINLKKGGVDTIVAYIVVMIPLMYVLVFMIGTLYHYTVQMYMNQVVKEVLIMASSYGTITTSMAEGESSYMGEKFRRINIPLAEDKTRYYVRKLDYNDGTIAPKYDVYDSVSEVSKELEKGDLLGIYVESFDDSLLGKISNFGLFRNQDTTSGVKYSSFREEIIRNENPQKSS